MNHESIESQGHIGAKRSMICSLRCQIRDISHGHVDDITCIAHIITIHHYQLNLDPFIICNIHKLHFLMALRNHNIHFLMILVFHGFNHSIFLVFFPLRRNAFTRVSTRGMSWRAMVGGLWCHRMRGLSCREGQPEHRSCPALQCNVQRFFF